MIPQWNNAGVLPPIRPGQPGHSSDRSPYRVPLTAVVEQFATSTQRVCILRGLINYRDALLMTPIIGGFQWLDGSFIEDQETLAASHPNDIDVVTFYTLPLNVDQTMMEQAAPDLFDNLKVKEDFRVDAYTHQIGRPLERFDVRQISYWYSMWSHRRNGTWKGFVQVELSSDENLAAAALLEQIVLERGLA